MVLAIALGPRPAQLALLKVKDLSITQCDDGSKVYILQVTRLKQGKCLFAARRLVVQLTGWLSTVC